MNEPKRVNKNDINKEIIQTDEVQKAIAKAIETEDDILLQPVSDRRILPNVPDKDSIRSNIDRRGINNKEHIDDYAKSMDRENTGKRYIIDYPITLNLLTEQGEQIEIKAEGKNISSSGLLCRVQKISDANRNSYRNNNEF